MTYNNHRLGIVLIFSHHRNSVNQLLSFFFFENKCLTNRSTKFNSQYSSYPLIQLSFVKLGQLAQFDKTSHAW